MLYRCGHTREVEFREYQPWTSPVCVAWVEEGGVLQPGEERVLLTVIASSLEEVLEEVEEVTTQSLDSLLLSHASGWEEVWTGGTVTVEGEDDHLARSLLAAQYYLYLSLPFPHLSSRPLPLYCGLSPGGLANGLLGQDYQVNRRMYQIYQIQGHNFWDTASWMFPGILLLQPEQARALVDYRFIKLSKYLFEIKKLSAFQNTGKKRGKLAQQTKDSMQSKYQRYVGTCSVIIILSASMVAFPFIKHTERRWKSCLMTSPSSCPVCLAQLLHLLPCN